MTLDDEQGPSAENPWKSHSGFRVASFRKLEALQNFWSGTVDQFHLELLYSVLYRLHLRLKWV